MDIVQNYGYNPTYFSVVNKLNLKLESYNKHIQTGRIFKKKRRISNVLYFSSMRIIVLLILLTGCINQNLELQKENMRLKDEVNTIRQQANTLRNEAEALTNEVDSLKTELFKCDMMLESFEGTR